MPITEPKFNKDAMPFDEDTFDCIKPKSMEEATRKAHALLEKTKSNLAKKGKGPKTDADKECLESIMGLRWISFGIRQSQIEIESLVSNLRISLQQNWP